MRILVILLALANLTLFAYAWLDRSSGSEPERLERQIDRDRVKLLTPPQVAALGPAKTAELPNVCLEWGPFTDSERERAAAILEPFQLGRLLSTRRVEVSNAFWVFVPPAASRQSAERTVAELRGAGFADLFVVDAGEMRNAVSLGIFRSEEVARRLADEARAKGFAAVRSGARGQGVAQTLLVVRDPQAPLLARVRDAQAEFSGVEARTRPCQEPN